MKRLNILLNKGLRYQSFRHFMAWIYPFFKKTKIIAFMKRVNNGSFSDPYDHFEAHRKGVINTYELENFDLEEALNKYSIDFKKGIQINGKYKFAFLIKPDECDLFNITKSCQNLGVDYTVYDIMNPESFDKLVNFDFDGVIICPSYENTLMRSVFHEIIQILDKETNLNIYPSVPELNFYESKRALSLFLSANNIPCPSTRIFYDFERAKKYLGSCRYPVVFKTNIGAGSSGVEILQSKKQAIRLAKQMFFRDYLRKFESERRSIEWGYFLVQEYIENVKEYRVIKIGDSWFGYQKWKKDDQEFLSGSGEVKMSHYPSEKLLNFCYNIADKHHFTTMSFDVFENSKGEFLINELQTWFGSYDPTEMYVNNIPGRFRYINGSWIFEPGFYNVYGSIALRLVNFISILQKEKAIV